MPAFASLAATRFDQPFEFLADNRLGQLRHDFPGDFFDELARGRLQRCAQKLFLRGNGRRLSVRGWNMRGRRGGNGLRWRGRHRRDRWLVLRRRHPNTRRHR